MWLHRLAVYEVMESLPAFEDFAICFYQPRRSKKRKQNWPPSIPTFFPTSAHFFK